MFVFNSFNSAIADSVGSIDNRDQVTNAWRHVIQVTNAWRRVIQVTNAWRHVIQVTNAWRHVIQVTNNVINVQWPH